MRAATRTQIRLLVLVFLAFLPAVLLYGFARATLEGREQERQEQELRQLARITYFEYGRLISRSEQLLAVLSEFPEIREGANPACSTRLASVLRHMPEYTTITLIGGDGYLACGSLTPEGDLYLGDRSYYLLATTVNRFSVGEYAVGRITGKPTVGVAYPIVEEEERSISKVLAASIDLSSLGAVVPGVDFPSHGTLTVLDRKGTVLVRASANPNPLGPDTVGSMAPESFADLGAAGGSVASPSLITATDLDGVDRVFAVVPLHTGRAVSGYILVGKDEAMVLDEIRAGSDRELQLLGFGGLAVILLAWLFGHYGLVREAREEQPA